MSNFRCKSAGFEKKGQAIWWEWFQSIVSQSETVRQENNDDIEKLCNYF